jgi:hypothetical protein
MFLMPSAACCSDTSLSLGTTGILVGVLWSRLVATRTGGGRRVSRGDVKAVECGRGRFTADQKRAYRKRQIGGAWTSAAGVEVTDLLCGFGAWRKIWMKRSGGYQSPRQTVITMAHFLVAVQLHQDVRPC